MTNLDNIDGVFFKREDQNPTGSAKDRAIPVQLQNLISAGYTQAVISSTGNAAISAQFYCQQNNIKLHTFVSPHTDPAKLKLLDHYQISSQPISDAIKFAKQSNSYLLRQSTDPFALTGYSQIGKELISQCPQISSLFIPVSSGTTLLGISLELPPSVKIFAVQPAAHCQIASHFDHDYVSENTTITDSLGVKFLPLKQKVISKCYSGIVVQDSDILPKIDTSAEGNLAFAGYLKATHKYDVGKFPVILLTGTKR